MRKISGVTLIGLILTIIVLLILAGVSIEFANNLIIEKSILASTKAMTAAKNESEELRWVENYGNVLLKDNVKIGDYVDYAFEYYDVYTEEYYTSSNGWRVIDISDSEGVKIISTGIPAKYYYVAGNNELQNDFEEVIFKDYNENPMIGKDFKVDKIGIKVQNLSLGDFNNYCNKIYKASREPNDISAINKNYELFYMQEVYLRDEYKKMSYWLSTEDIGNNKLYYISQELIESESNCRNGIRPVITLNENLIGTYENGVWECVN